MVFKRQSCCVTWSALYYLVVRYGGAQQPINCQLSWLLQTVRKASSSLSQKVSVNLAKAGFI